MNGLSKDTGADSKRERLIFPTTIFWADGHILGEQQGERLQYEERQRKTESFLFRISTICNERTIPVSQSSSTMSSGTATRDNWRRTFAMQLKEKKQKDACLLEELTHLHGGSHVAVGQKGVWSCPGSSEHQTAASRLASQTTGYDWHC